jgi:hypothetical protein
MERWDYCIFTAKESREGYEYTLAYDGKLVTPRGEDKIAVLSALGNVGWQLVGVAHLGAGVTELYLRKAKA